MVELAGPEVQFESAGSEHIQARVQAQLRARLGLHTRAAPSTRVLSYLTLKLFEHLAIGLGLGLNLELGKNP